MGVVDALLGARTARRPDTGRVAAALRAEPAAGLAQLQRLLESAALRESPAESRLAALESLRGEWRGAIEPMLAALRDRPIPLEADALASLHRAGLALRALREAYRATHDALRDGRPEGAPPPRALLALARALDAQSRLLVAACRLRVALPREDWDEACRLALPLRAASALDEAFPDPTSDARVETPRAAFVLPLLLRLLEPLGLATWVSAEEGGPYWDGNWAYANLGVLLALGRRSLLARLNNMRIDNMVVKRDKWGFMHESDVNTYLDMLKKIGDVDKSVDPKVIYTNELIDEINRFDVADVRRRAREFKA